MKTARHAAHPPPDTRGKRFELKLRDRDPRKPGEVREAALQIRDVRMGKQCSKERRYYREWQDKRVKLTPRGSDAKKARWRSDKWWSHH